MTQEVGMKQTLKIGITVLVVAAMAMSGIALAQTDEGAEEAQQNAVTRIAELLQALVDDGTITADQAEAVAEFMVENRPERKGPKGPRGGGEVAEFLGMTQEEFRAALQEFDTLADLAAANGSSGAALIDFMVGRVEERIAQAVADGKLTQDEADEKLAKLRDKITERVNSEIPEPGEGDRGPRGRRGPGGGEGGFRGAPPVDASINA
jgi:polyhydroxyalkanoate synthesis regulator phasin